MVLPDFYIVTLHLGRSDRALTVLEIPDHFKNVYFQEFIAWRSMKRMIRSRRDGFYRLNKTGEIKQERLCGGKFDDEFVITKIEGKGERAADRNHRVSGTA
ncbi:hypothetical protein C1X05_13610 [Laceyella sacchari]|uniref:Uncharacterized protein n=1 Tax=Laceyella tengchongensis TaxID=574699 RepID=A0AA45WSK1_9BACL|nr:hypothetical protein C1X05_13610 [Laceyella sacchari]SMP36582.1 hypothetical protein SAMN06265361_1235 [Laceyella tengchongensis]